MSWIHKTAIQQREALARGEISSLELLEETIAHTEKLSPFINPIALPLFDRARKSALAADKKLARRKGGPLCGIPITIKDSQWLAGVPCSNGSLTLKDYIPTETSEAVQRLENADAVIFAKTTCPEYSLSGITESEIYGRTSNPWDISRTSGGSSGGAAAAVAAGIGSLSLGGDGGGSIRIPSAFCGVTGFKPSHDQVPRAPGFATWESLVAYGPISRSVADAELMFAALTNNSSYSNPEVEKDKSIRFISSEDLGFAPIDDDVRYVFQSVIEQIQTAGHSIHFDNPGLTSSVAPWAITATHDMWQHKGEFRNNPKTSSNIGVYAKGFIDFGGTFSELEFSDAQAQRRSIHSAYLEMFNRSRSQILLTPTLGCEAFPHGTTYPQSIGSQAITYPWLDWAGFLYDANLAGLPVCCIPMGIGDEGLPISLQVTGLPGKDSEVLEAAKKIEKLLSWRSPAFELENYAMQKFSPSIPLNTAI
jgi:Asp-tRNA(Asn)/Glu-tRNA(Gln) amidotransferase A subunit family amidase